MTEHELMGALGLRKEAGAYKQLVKMLTRSARKGKILPNAINRLADTAYDNRMIRAFNTRLGRARQSVINHGKNADRLLNLVDANPAIKQFRGDTRIGEAADWLKERRNYAYESVHRSPSPNDYYDPTHWYGDDIMDMLSQRNLGTEHNIPKMVRERQKGIRSLRDIRDGLRRDNDDLWKLYKDAPKYK